MVIETRKEDRQNWSNVEIELVEYLVGSNGKRGGTESNAKLWQRCPEEKGGRVMIHQRQRKEWSKSSKSQTYRRMAQGKNDRKGMRGRDRRLLGKVIVASWNEN